MERGNRGVKSSKAQPQQKRVIVHEFKCASCQGILANFGRGDVKCFGIQSKPHLARYEKVPMTNKKSPYVILGLSTIAETTGQKKYKTQWGMPGQSLTFAFPLLFFRSWYRTIEQLTDLESQKKLRTKIYKRTLSPNAPIFVPRCILPQLNLERKSLEKTLKEERLRRNGNLEKIRSGVSICS